MWDQIYYYYYYYLQFNKILENKKTIKSKKQLRNTALLIYTIMTSPQCKKPSEG